MALFRVSLSSIITGIENRLMLAKGEGSKGRVNCEFGVSKMDKQQGPTA